jgi:hypothetical protein
VTAQTTGTLTGIARRRGILYFDVTEDGTGQMRSFATDGTWARADVREGQEHTTVYFDGDAVGPRYRAVGIYPPGWPEP